MDKIKYYRRFILLFFLGKLFLIGFTFFLGSFDVYGYDQIRDIQYIIVPTFATSLIIFLNYLKKIRSKTRSAKKKEKKATESVTTTETTLVFSALIFYLLFMTFQILSMDASPEAFIGLKLRIAFAEMIFGGLIGWVLFDINSHKK